MMAMAEMLLQTKAVTGTASHRDVPPSFPQHKLRCNGHSAKAKQSRSHSLTVTLFPTGWQSSALLHPCCSTRDMEPWQGVILWTRLS